MLVMLESSLATVKFYLVSHLDSVSTHKKDRILFDFGSPNRFTILGV